MTYKFGSVSTPPKYDKKYDALVDAGGGGDYLDIPDAISAGKKKLLIAPGTYSWSTVVLNDGDVLVLEGLSEKSDDIIIQPVLDASTSVFDISGITPPTNLTLTGYDYSYSSASKKVSLIQNFANYSDFTTLFSVNDVVSFGQPARQTSTSAPYAVITAVDSTSLTFNSDLYIFNQNDNTYNVHIFKEDWNPPVLACNNLTFDCTCDAAVWTTFIKDSSTDDWAVWIQKFRNVKIKYINYVSGSFFGYTANWGRVHKESFFHNVMIEGSVQANDMRIPNGLGVVHKNYSQSADLDFSDGSIYALGVVTDSSIDGGDYFMTKYKFQNNPVCSVLGNLTMDQPIYTTGIVGIVGTPTGTSLFGPNTGRVGTVTELVDTSSIPVTKTLYLWNMPPYTPYTIKDNGNAATNNITINTGDGALIDGQSSITINTNYSSVTLINDGSNWFII